MFNYKKKNSVKENDLLPGPKENKTINFISFLEKGASLLRNGKTKQKIYL